MKKNNLITALLLAAIILTLAGCNKTTETATNTDANSTEETAKTVLWEETCNMVSKTGDSENNPVIFIRAYDDGSYYVSSSVEFSFGGYEADLIPVSEGNDGDIIYNVEGTDTEFTIAKNTNEGGYTVSYNGEESFFGFLASEHFLVYEDTADKSDTETLEAEATTEAVTEETTTETVTEAATTETVKAETSKATTETAKATTKKTTANSSSTATNNSSSSVSTATNNGSSSGSATTTTTAASNSSSNNSSSSTASGNTVSSSSNSNSSNTSSSTTAHVHSYTIPVYKTVHHDAVTGTRTVETPVYKDVPVTKTVYCEKCDTCGQQGVTTYMYNQTDVDNHFKATGHGCYSSYQYQEDTGEKQTVLWKTEVTTETYVITEAYDEQVVDYYKCSCGATKK